MDANNILTLGREWVVILPETVLEEADNKKSGLGELAYQARSLGRLLAECTIVEVAKKDGATVTEMIHGDVHIEVVALDEYIVNSSDSGANDQRIIQVAEKYADVFMSNDTMARLRGLAVGLEVTDLKMTADVDHEFVKELLVDNVEQFRTLHNANILEVDKEYKIENYCYKFECTTTGQIKLGLVQNGFVTVIGKDSEKELRRQDVGPINSEQLMLSKAIQDPTIDLVVVEGKAGSGKNICAVSNSIKLMKLSRDKYENMVYIRNSVNDEELGEDVGYLAGNDEKMAVYLGPMEDTLDYIVRNRLDTKKMAKDEVEQKVTDMTSKLVSELGIQSMISTGLRGRTFHNSVIIIDEAQNTSSATMQKILSRVGKNCKVIVLGSLRQIDNKYITKYSNGLAILMDETSKQTVDAGISMFAITLEKVARSEMALFAERLFSK